MWKSPKRVHQPKDAVMPIVNEPSDYLKLYIKTLWTEHRFRFILGIAAVLLTLLCTYILGLQYLSLLIPAIGAWVAPSTRSSGDLITASIWNQDVVANVQYLHDLAEVVRIEQRFDDPGSGAVEDDNDGWHGAQISAGQYAIAGFSVDDDYASLQLADIMFVPDATETIQFDLNVWIAADGEDRRNHSASASNLTLGVTNDEIAVYDISAYLTDLAASDYVTVRLSADTSDIYPIRLTVEYIRA